MSQPNHLHRTHYRPALHFGMNRSHEIQLKDSIILFSLSLSFLTRLNLLFLTLVTFNENLKRSTKSLCIYTDTFALLHGQTNFTPGGFEPDLS